MDIQVVDRHDRHPQLDPRGQQQVAPEQHHAELAEHEQERHDRRHGIEERLDVSHERPRDFLEQALLGRPLDPPLLDRLRAHQHARRVAGRRLVVQIGELEFLRDQRVRHEDMAVVADAEKVVHRVLNFRLGVIDPRHRAQIFPELRVESAAVRQLLCDRRIRVLTGLRGPVRLGRVQVGDRMPGHRRHLDLREQVRGCPQLFPGQAHRAVLDRDRVQHAVPQVARNRPLHVDVRSDSRGGVVRIAVARVAQRSEQVERVAERRDRRVPRRSGRGEDGRERFRHLHAQRRRDRPNGGHADRDTGHGIDVARVETLDRHVDLRDEHRRIHHPPEQEPLQLELLRDQRARGHDQQPDQCAERHHAVELAPRGQHRHADQDLLQQVPVR